MDSLKRPPSTTAPLVRARHLTKAFNHRKAVDDISFDIWPGEVVGFLGPNGAGKTTTIRMLLDILKPTAGELTIFGLAYLERKPEILRQMNASSGTLTLPGKLTVIENLRVFSDFYGIASPEKRVQEVLDRFDLAALKNLSLYSLSTGQQVRVSLAKAFLNRPRLLLLDEPTASLDPDVADRVRSSLIQAVKDEEITVFLTSHNMGEVEKVCSRVLFLNHGTIQAEGTPRELARRVKRWTVNLKTKRPLHELPKINLPKEADITVDQHDLIAEMDRTHVGPFLTELVKQGIEIESVSIREPTLEDFFVHSARRKGE